MNNKLGQEPAFPTKYTIKDVSVGGKYFEEYEINQEGMSKRFYAACAAMRSLIESKEFNDSVTKTTTNSEEGISIVVTAAYMFADELLKQEGK